MNVSIFIQAVSNHFKTFYYLEDHLLTETDRRRVAFGMEAIFQFVFPDADLFHFY